MLIRENFTKNYKDLKGGFKIGQFSDGSRKLEWNMMTMGVTNAPIFFRELFTKFLEILNL